MPRGQKPLEDISILEDIGLEDIRLPCSTRKDEVQAQLSSIFLYFAEPCQKEHKN